jgi:hypothetical protein
MRILYLLLIPSVLQYAYLSLQLSVDMTGEGTLGTEQKYTYPVHARSPVNRKFFTDIPAAIGHFDFGNSVGDIATTFNYDLWVKTARTVNMIAENKIWYVGADISLVNFNRNRAILNYDAGYGNMGIGLTVVTNGIKARDSFLIQFRQNHSE